ncbi:MAG TPA: helix-hairpin-helix domain-containing protein, partial [Candidatus Hydrogenedentes bacterium]|nr:helix-hairpin-helix domain-containing protein [Candidatus Hydrogenedentota bacterium]
VAFRAKNGAFTSREQLKQVPRLGDRTFEQAAGFLRVMNGDNPLDASGWPVVPSGLAGPVTLEVLRPLDPGDVGNKATSSR